MYLCHEYFSWIMNYKNLFHIIVILSLIACERKVVKTQIIETWPNNKIKTLHEYFNVRDSSFREIEFYESGKIKSRFYYQDRKIEGLAIGFFENGDTAQITHFHKGLKDGLEKTWYSSGELWSEYIFEGGRKISGNHFFRNGQPTATLRFKDGYVVWGEYYHPNGKVRSTGSIHENQKTGFWNYYYQNGTKKESGSYLEGEKHGIWEYYHETGNLKEMGEYDEGKKIGVWQEFDEEGNLIHDIYF